MSRHPAQERIAFTGIDALTGRPSQPTIHPATLAARVWENRSRDPALAWDERKELGWWSRHRRREPDRRPAADIDPKDLSSAGWGVIFAEKSGSLRREEVEKALQPLLDHRREQAQRGHAENDPIRYFRILDYRRGETKDSFFRRFNTQRGPAHPKQLPYYLLLVGGPEDIPPRFQYLLDTQHAVGRIHFDDLEAYACYANSVVRAEGGEHRVRPEMEFFSVRNPGDRATERSEKGLIQPLIEALERERKAWKIKRTSEPTKAALASILADAPALLFSAAHGAAYPCGHPDQPARQGAIVCQDWLGRGPAGPEYQFAAADLRDARVHGMIAFLFGCYSAGTPQDDNFPTPPMRNPRRRAPAPFVSALAQGLLGHPDGGALAVLGHIDQTWTRTFGTGEGKGCWHIESFLKQLLDGNPVGHAMDWMNERFAEMSAELTDVLDERREILPGETVDARWLSGLWRANNDARNFVLLGDPAVRLAALPAVPDASQKHAPAVSLRESLSSIIQRGAAIRPSRTPAEILSRDADPDLAR